MNPDLLALAKNKKAWVGVGGAAALGGFVYLRRKKAGAAPAPGTSTGAAAGATAPGGAGAVADTSGYNMASFLGNYSQSLQDQLTAGLNAIKDTTNAAPSLFSTAPGESLADVAKATGDTIDQLMQLNPWLTSYLKDANQYGYISPTNPADRPGGGPVSKVFWVGAPVKTR